MSARDKRFGKWWQTIIIDMIKHCGRNAPSDDEGELVKKFRDAIEEACEYFDSTEYGDDIRKIMTMLYIDGTHSRYGVANELNLSERSVCRRRSMFVQKVAEIVGFENVAR